MMDILSAIAVWLFWIVAGAWLLCMIGFLLYTVFVENDGPICGP